MSRKYDTKSVLSYSVIAASATFVVGCVFRDMRNDERMREMSYTLNNLEADMDYLTERARVDDPNCQWTEDE